MATKETYRATEITFQKIILAKQEKNVIPENEIWNLIRMSDDSMENK